LGGNAADLKRAGGAGAAQERLGVAVRLGAQRIRAVLHPGGPFPGEPPAARRRGGRGGGLEGAL